MREILFRGKRPNGCWVQGDLTQFCIDGVMTSKISNHDLRATLNGLRVSTYTNDVIPETVGQYTGLTDKNGKKIFEGDIVKDEQAQMLGKVVYATATDGFDGMAGFMVDDIDDGLQNYNGFWHLVEVIGNIHDKPELLKG